MKSEFVKIMQERGFVHQCTDLDALDRQMAAGSVTGYCGFDATAPSLHVGSLMPIMILHWLEKTGHKPIVLMGGATTKIGDPTDKTETRKMLSDETIAENIAGIRKIFERYLQNPIMVNNIDWLGKLNYLDFLSDFGRHFTINRMMTFDSVKLRLEREQPLTFLEFNYMIMQGYDFYELNKRYNCAVQFGGSDQWGNMVNGVELTRRVAQKEVFAMTCPLLTKHDGEKMGKSVSGAVWLNADMRSPYEFYQYFRNVDDKDVSKLLRLLTVLPMAEIAKLESLKGTEINDAKKALAFEITRLCHGETTAQHAAETARRAFEEGESAEGLPTITVPMAKLKEGIPVFVLFKDAGLATSGGEARRLIAGGGAKINDQKVDSDTRLVTAADLQDNKIKLSAGKKKHALIVAE
jgi:tyrosyl-tRNA synthetase